jgi:hypothetical protein
MWRLFISDITADTGNRGEVERNSCEDCVNSDPTW